MRPTTVVVFAVLVIVISVAVDDKQSFEDRFLPDLDAQFERKARRGGRLAGVVVCVSSLVPMVQTCWSGERSGGILDGNAIVNKVP